MAREGPLLHTYNPAEAVAQAQKAVCECFDIRRGYAKLKVKNAAGVEEIISLKLPDIPPKTRGMMNLILEAPTGIEATDEVIARLTERLKKEFGARDLQTALQEVVGNVTSLKTVKLPNGYTFL